MISDNLLPIAMFVFAMLFIGLVLTFIEFRYGAPKHQEDQTDEKLGSVGKDHTSE
jgi:hypothetical protein